MNFKLIAKNAVVKPKDLEDFIRNLRRYNQQSVVSSGAFLYWEAFRNRGFRTDHEDKLNLINPYGAKVIIFSLATGNNWRNLLASNSDFYDFCTSYMHIPCSISDKDFLNNEAKEIAAELKKASVDKRNIGKDRIIAGLVREICAVVFISRGVGIQHRDFLMGIEELYRDFRIIQLLDMRTNNEASKIIEAIFGINVVRVIRSAWGIFSLGADVEKNGSIKFNALTCEEDLTERLLIDIDTCLSVAHNVSYKESELKATWLDKVFSVKTLYQQYFPDPLYTHALIHRNESGIENHFLIPSPGLFIRGFRQAIFSMLYKNAENKGKMGSEIGNAIMDHIQEALQNIFGKDKVRSIQDADKHADFYVVLNNLDLVIEVKTSIGGAEDKAIMSPAHLVAMWNRLYQACVQCSYSMKELADGKRRVFPIVLLVDHVTAEHISFQSYAEKSGIFSDLGIHEIEFMSWNALEDVLSKTSISVFEETLIKKWDEKDAITLGDVLGFSMERDTPAHDYQYLKSIEMEIFNKM